MRKLRLTIVTAAIVVCVLLGLLVSRAIRSVEAERDLRHEILAERVLDEMERELTAFLRIEEERPFEHYRYFYIPADAPQAVLVRSPLADLPSEPFVVGHFQVDANGDVTTPLVDGELVPAPVSGWGPSESLHRALATIHSVVTGWSSGGDASRSVEVPSREPGIRVGRVDRSVTSEEYLRALNRAAVARQNRISQNAFTPVQNMMAPDDWPAVEEGADAAKPRSVPVFLGPMVGQRSDRDRLLLYRRVSAEESTYRQGMVIELAALVRWLEQRVLSGSELESHARLLLGERDVGNADAAVYRFPHRFAEPFQDLEGVLVLASLPEPRGPSYVYVLSLLVVVTAASGLYGLYRIVGAEMAFAARRQSFVSAVSHELRTPLTAIRMHAEMLRDGVVLEPEKRQQYYEVMTAESERLTRLVNNVLEMSRFERDEPRPTPKSGPLRPVLIQVLETLQPHASQEGFDLHLDVDDELPDAIHDRDGLLQVLFNLVDNAIKYGGSSTRNDIVLRARAVQEGIELEVRDRGPGVAESALAHVFEPYYRGTTPDAVPPKGSGMGLALVRRLVVAMGGTVVGQNAADGGFRVRIRLARREGG